MPRTRVSGAGRSSSTTTASQVNPWRGGHGARPHHRDWVVFTTEPSLATTHGHVDRADLFDEIRLRLFPTAWSRWPADHRLVTISPPAGGKAGSFLGVDEQVYSPSDFVPCPRPPGPRPGPQSLPCRVRFRSRGTRPSWIGRECYAVDRKDSCAASTGAGPMRVVLGPGRSYTKCSSSRPWWPDCGRSG